MDKILHEVALDNASPAFGAEGAEQNSLFHSKQEREILLPYLP
jgi:hypothetical protein